MLNKISTKNSFKTKLKIIEKFEHALDINEGYLKKQ
jgi:hypothetical protein